MEGFNLFDTESLTDTIKVLLDGEDLETKTEINNPVAFSIIELIAHRCEKVGFTRSAFTINFYLERFRINMVSFKRKSRKEFIEALNSLRSVGMPEQLTNSEKLIDNIKE